MDDEKMGWVVYMSTNTWGPFYLDTYVITCYEYYHSFSQTVVSFLGPSFLGPWCTVVLANQHGSYGVSMLVLSIGSEWREMWPPSVLCLSLLIISLWNLEEVVGRARCVPQCSPCWFDVVHRALFPLLITANHGHGPNPPGTQSRVARAGKTHESTRRPAPEIGEEFRKSGQELTNHGRQVSAHRPLEPLE